MTHTLFPPTQRPVLPAFLPKINFPAKAQLTVLAKPRGLLARRIGFNVEIQENADQLNLWDWLADSGAQVLREFHPEVNLRRAPIAPGRWGAIATADDLATLRRRAVADPHGGVIDWANYRFAENLPWLGVPDRILEKAKALDQIETLVPLGYVPRMFPRPLVPDFESAAIPADHQIDWEAAASAWEYFFALAYHFAGQHRVHTFLMCNEPEWRSGGFWLPKAVEALGKDWFPAFFYEYRHEDLRERFFASLAVQSGVLARVARLALDDAAEALGERSPAPRLRLGGPVASNWEAYWPHVAPWVDIADYHHYSAEPTALRGRYRKLRAACADQRPLAMSEFNRIAGEMDLADSYFAMPNALAFAQLLLQAMRLAEPGEPAIDYLAIYLFAHPCTHRNYKSLVYGDMNLVDWTGCDARLHSSPEHHPTVDEMQLRFPTPAYACFRMLARCTAGGISHAELEAPLTLRDNALAPPICQHLDTLVVRQDDRLIITILNRNPVVMDPLMIDLSALGDVPGQAVVRRTSVGVFDEVQGGFPLHDSRFPLELPPNSLTQVILSDLDPATISGPRLVERGHGPGALAKLGLWQTTRLRLEAQVNGVPRDLTDHLVVWRSEAPRLVRVGSGGLVQRMRSTSRTVRIQAGLSDGRILAEAEVPGDLAS
ncbi:hypothetical protein LBMAG53_11350 [Planctomycetota bacterium]|nr:hypothetical protein LBMAG53_11350 [Planctomycetota bacterium]